MPRIRQSPSARSAGRAQVVQRLGPHGSAYGGQLPPDLGPFCESVGVTPSEYVRLKAKQRDDLLDDEV